MRLTQRGRANANSKVTVEIAVDFKDDRQSMKDYLEAYTALLDTHADMSRDIAHRIGRARAAEASA